MQKFIKIIQKGIKQFLEILKKITNEVLEILKNITNNVFEISKINIGKFKNLITKICTNVFKVLKKLQERCLVIYNYLRSLCLDLFTKIYAYLLPIIENEKKLWEKALAEEYIDPIKKQLENSALGFKQWVDYFRSVGKMYKDIFQYLKHKENRKTAFKIIFYKKERDEFYRKNLLEIEEWIDFLTYFGNWVFILMVIYLSVHAGWLVAVDLGYMPILSDYQENKEWRDITPPKLPPKK